MLRSCWIARRRGGMQHALPDNHNVMVGYTPSTGMIVQWKNCDTDEDCNGQRMLYSHSDDGRTWSSPPRILFPNMTTLGVPTTLEPGPPVYLNGRMYMAASPGFHNTTHDASAQGECVGMTGNVWYVCGCGGGGCFVVLA